MRKLTPIVASAVLGACAVQANQPPEEEGGPNVTIVGDTAFLELPVGRSADNGELRVTFENVSEDSRCPAGVQCVWEGNASIRVTVEMGNESQVAILNSTLNPQRASFFGYTIGYRDLSPYPVADTPHDPGDYRATISVLDTR